MISTTKKPCAVYWKLVKSSLIHQRFVQSPSREILAPAARTILQERRHADQAPSIVIEQVLGRLLEAGEVGLMKNELPQSPCIEMPTVGIGKPGDMDAGQCILADSVPRR